MLAGLGQYQTAVETAITNELYGFVGGCFGRWWRRVVHAFGRCVGCQEYGMLLGSVAIMVVVARVVENRMNKVYLLPIVVMGHYLRYSPAQVILFP